MLDLGDRLSSYEPLWDNWYKDEYIGGGNFGKVYKLKTNLYGETVYSAVKIIPVMFDAELTSVRTDKEGFVNGKKQAMVQEIKNMFRLKDKPHLVQCINHSIKDIYDDAGDIVGFDVLIQMNYYKSLTAHLKKAGALNENEAEKVALQVAEGLRYMHEINMLHRDIKPDNIYINDNGNYLLGDFGISKQEAQSSYSTMAGTQPFIAPEVWKVQHTNRRYTKTADIYSFGITMYYLLNDNSLPLVGKDATRNMIDDAVFERLNGKAFPPPKNGNTALKDVVMKCCSYYPEARYQSMEELIDALKKCKVSSVPSAQKTEEEQYATMFAGASTSTGNSAVPTTNSSASTNYDNNSYIYNAPEDISASKQGTPTRNSRTGTAAAVNGTNKIIVGLTSVVALLIMGLIAMMFIFINKKKDPEDNKIETTTTTTTTTTSAPVTTAEDNFPIIDSETSTETTLTDTEKVTESIEPETSTKKTDTTTVATTVATTATEKRLITEMQKPAHVYSGIEEGDIYYYSGPANALLYGPDPNKYDQIGVIISADDIIQEHGRTNDGSWLYVSIHGFNECGWIKNNKEQIIEMVETPGMTSQTGYLDEFYTGKIIKDTAFRCGPNDIRDPIKDCNTIPKGKEVEVMGSCSGWYYISYGAYEGWISVDDVSLS